MGKDIYASWRRLPTGVQWWVGVLILVNSGWLALLGTPTGQATGLAALFVLVTNVPIILHCRGMSRLMSMPHLLAWIPLQVYLVLRLQGLGGLGAPLTPEVAYALVVLLVNGVSLVFDVVDSWRWLNGQRETI